MDDSKRFWMTQEEVQCFVGPNADYYKEKWAAHADTNWYKGWNGASFLFFFEWAAYRKLYREIALLFLLLYTTLFVVMLIFPALTLLAELIVQSSRLVFSFFANGLYRAKALRTVRRTDGMDEEEKCRHLSRKGGTSAVGLAVCLLLELGLAVLPYLL